MKNSLSECYRLITAGCAILLSLAYIPASYGQAPATQPNVLFIAIDDLRPELGCYGVAGMHTPNIDALADSGVLFEKHYVQVAVCIPSRVSLFTTLRSERTRQLYGPNQWENIPGVQTLGQIFSDAGYYTAAVGKMWHTTEGTHSDQFDFEWNSNAKRYADPINTELHADYNRRIREATEQGLPRPVFTQDELPAVAERLDVDDSAYDDWDVAENAIQILQDRALDQEPFMLAVGFKKPHLPFNAPEQYWALYNEADMPLANNPNYPQGMPEVAFNNNPNMRNYSYGDYPPYDHDTKSVEDSTARHLIHAYRAATSYADAQMGRVMDELVRLGLDDNTIVILWGDHGWHLGDSGMWSKHSNFEVATRSPLIIRAPGWTSPGGRSEALVETVDLIPTMLEYCGLPPLPVTDGKSLEPLLHNPNVSGDEAAFHLYDRWGQDGTIGYAVRTDRYRLVSWRETWSIHSNEVAAELYDYHADPYETVNQAYNAEYASVVENLRTMLIEGPAGQFSDPAFANSIDFTSPTYANGALDGQDTWNGSVGAVTDADGVGVLDLDDSVSFATSAYNSANLPSSDDVYRVSADFSVVFGTATAAPSRNLFRIQFSQNNSGNDYDSGLFFARTNVNGNEAYRITRGTLGNFVPGADLTGSQIGVDFSQGDYTTDTLRMTYTLNRGPSASAWTYTATLMNLSNSFEILNTFSGSLSVDEDFHNGSLIDVGINNMQFRNAGAEVDSISITDFGFDSYQDQVVPPATGPNIVLLYADDLGYMDTTVYGSLFHQTPNIDQLASDGMRFTQAYSVAPLCAPSRISMISGRYGVRNQSYEVVPGPFLTAGQGGDVPMYGADNTLALPTNTPTLAQVLQANGYRCGVIGKWHMGPTSDITVHGFEEFVIMRTNNQDTHFDSTKALVTKTSDYPDPIALEYSSDYATRCATHFLDSTDSRPFFMYVPYTLVHTPVEARADLKAKYQALLPSPSTYQTSADYAAMVEALDESIGAIIDELDTRGLLDNTVVIFSSDNGGLYNVGGFGDGTYGVNFPLRDAKATLWEGGIRVPMTISHGGSVQSGLVSDTVVSQLDILPTILELTGLSDELPAVLPDGYSLIPALDDANFQFPDRDLYFHHPGYRNRMDPSSAIRYGDWKLIEELEDGSVTLFDLANDLSETTDLSASHPQVVQGLLAKLYAWREDTNAPMPAYRQRFDSGQTYTDNELIAQKNWSGNAGHFTVADSANDGRVDINPTASWRRANFDDGNLDLNNVAYTMTVPFSFSRSSASVSNKHILGLEFNEDGENATYEGLRGYLTRVSDTTYRLGFSSFIQGQNNNGTTFNQSALGFSGSESTSDELELNFQITRGADETDWSYVVTLVNLDDDTIVSTLTGSGAASTSQFFSSDIDVALNTMTANEASISNMRVHYVAFIPKAYLAPRGYPVWAQIKEVSSNALGNDDGDKYNNLMEYALGGDPNNPLDMGIAPTFSYDPNLAQFTFKFVELTANDAGITYAVEQSSTLDLGSWSDTGWTIVSTPTDDPRFDAMEYTAPMGEDDQKFVRLRVVEPE